MGLLLRQDIIGFIIKGTSSFFEKKDDIGFGQSTCKSDLLVLRDNKEILESFSMNDIIPLTEVDKQYLTILSSGVAPCVR